ncbi:MAG TPA: hypothetical protein VIC71_03650 [Gammaproteobacteria bacterium]|jgi:hypothetical protein
MRGATKEKIAQEVRDWRHEGLIDAALADLLVTRFAGGPTYLTTALRWLGFFALYLFAQSVLGLIGMLLGEAALVGAVLLVGGLSGAAWYFGTRLVTNPEQRYPTSGAVLLTAGLIGVFGTLTTAFFAFGGEEFGTVYPWFMLLTAAAALATAYRYALRWPLVVGLLVLFHALGNWHEYAGHGAYYLGMRDERITAVAGALALAFGHWHETRVERDNESRFLGFGHAFIVFGLLYANLSAWFLSLFPGGSAYVLVFSVACLAQLVLGASLRDPRFTGFGIVFLSIDLYTRFFEQFWGSLSKGAFFVLAGLVAVAAGGLMELLARGRQQREAP